MVTGAKVDETFKADDIPVAIDLPASVDLVIIATEPPIKGASASANKPATLSMGLIVQVAEHISTGDKIKVNTNEYKFMGCADPK